MHIAMDLEEDRLIRRISPNDGMAGGDLPHYFAVGRSGILNIKRALARALDDTQPRRILDFPCGHGRVLRYLRAEFPEAEITACDLLRDGVDFCAQTFGAIPVYSDSNPARIPLPRSAFDLIWVGSLFTHFDAPRWTIFLSFLRDLLEPGGVLVFSTHGRRSHEILTEHPQVYDLDPSRRAKLLRRYQETGFGYVDYPAHRAYGISIAEPGWVCGVVTSIAGLKLVNLVEAAWDFHHDVFTCTRDTESDASDTW